MFTLSILDNNKNTEEAKPKSEQQKPATVQ